MKYSPQKINDLRISFRNKKIQNDEQFLTIRSIKFSRFDNFQSLLLQCKGQEYLKQKNEISIQKQVSMEKKSQGKDRKSFLENQNIKTIHNTKKNRTFRPLIYIKNRKCHSEGDDKREYYFPQKKSLKQKQKGIIQPVHSRKTQNFKKLTLSFRPIRSHTEQTEQTLIDQVPLNVKRAYIYNHDEVTSNSISNIRRKIQISMKKCQIQQHKRCPQIQMNQNNKPAPNVITETKRNEYRPWSSQKPFLSFVQLNDLNKKQFFL